MSDPRRAWFDGLPNRYVVGHRGAAGTVPENTIESFQRAIDLGAQAIEFDVQETADGVWVVMHDEAVNRTTNGVGLVRSMSWNAVSQLDAGYYFKLANEQGFPWRGRGVRVPRLVDVLEALPKTKLVIEVKTRQREAACRLASFLETHQVQERSLVCSFYDELLIEFRRHAPMCATGAGSNEASRFILDCYMGRKSPVERPYQALTIPRHHRGLPLVTRGVIDAARRRGMHVQVWTINRPSLMRKLYRRGAQAMTTDYPDRAVAVLKDVAME